MKVTTTNDFITEISNALTKEFLKSPIVIGGIIVFAIILLAFLTFIIIKRKKHKNNK